MNSKQKARVSLILDQEDKDNFFDVAQENGLDMNNALRFIMNKVIKYRSFDLKPIENIPYVDAQTEIMIGESMKDLATGKYQDMNSKEDIVEFIEDITNEV